MLVQLAAYNVRPSLGLSGDIHRPTSRSLKLSRPLLGGRAHTLGFRHHTAIARTGGLRHHTVGFRQLLVQLAAYNVRPSLGLRGNTKSSATSGAELAGSLLSGRAHTLGFRHHTSIARTGGLRHHTVGFRQLLIQLAAYGIRPPLGLLRNTQGPTRGCARSARNLPRKRAHAALRRLDLTIRSLNSRVRGCSRTQDPTTALLGRALSIQRSAADSTGGILRNVHGPFASPLCLVYALLKRLLSSLQLPRNLPRQSFRAALRLHHLRHDLITSKLRPTQSPAHGADAL